ncbi:MAG: carbohydrate-binding protein [Phycisphaerales bacterium]|nr:carbohydrate-binding protein [Phycisphaerales bacterium]
MKDHSALLSRKVNRRVFISSTTAGAMVASFSASTVGAAETVRQNAARAKPPATSASISPSAYQKAHQRAAALVARMTLTEKAAQLGNTTPAIKRLGLPAYQYWHEALHGLARSGPCTSFPVPLALANTWNPELAVKVYAAISDEARAYHNKHGTPLAYYSPQTLNPAKDPRWGRIDETLGEDPHLMGTLVASVVRGMQGDHPDYLKTVCCAKHFICNETDDDRHTTSANVNSRSFWEYYTRPFRSAVDAGVFTVMGAYNKINGIPCCADRFLLTDLLRRRWGFRGYVTSDCDAVSDICQTHHYVPTNEQAAALAIQAGCDLNCGFAWGTYQKYLPQAVALELVSENDIDQALTRIITARFLFGEFDDMQQVPYHAIPFSVVDSPKHRALALEASRQSLVLLKNARQTLPLNKAHIKKVAVIGPMADRCAIGGYSGGPFMHVSPLQGIAAALGSPIADNRIAAINFSTIDWDYKFFNCVLPDATLGLMQNNFWVQLPAADFTGRTSITACASCAAGGAVVEVRLDSPTGRVVARIKIAPTGSWDTFREFSAPISGATGNHSIFLVFTGDAAQRDLLHLDYIEFHPLKQPKPGNVQVSFVRGCTVQGPANPAWLHAATKAAEEADVVFLVLGTDQTVDHEQLDRKDIRLPGAQHDLAKLVYNANARTVLILSANCPVAIPWEDEHIPAILCALCAGQSQGTAIAEALFGQYNPGGKLAETWYRSVHGLPDFHDYDVTHGRTYLYFRGQCLYPFGFGLSYSTFAFRDLKTDAASLAAGEVLRVSVIVKNTGTVAGSEVVQFYIAPPKSKPPRPIKQLVGFKRVELKAGESRNVTFALPYNDQSLWYWDESQRQFVLQPGKVQLLIGSSSSHIHQSSQVQLEPCRDAALGSPESLQTIVIHPVIT